MEGEKRPFLIRFFLRVRSAPFSSLSLLFHPAPLSLPWDGRKAADAAAAPPLAAKRNGKNSATTRKPR